MPGSKKPRLRKQDAQKPVDEPPAPGQESLPAIPEEFVKVSREESPLRSTEVSSTDQTGENAVSDTQTQLPNDSAAAADAAAADAATAGAAAEINRLKADIIITRHVAVAAGAGFIPVPIVDFAAVTGVQLSMLALICDIYGQPFSKEAATSIVASLVGGAVGGEAATLTNGSRVKFIPVVGTVVSWLVTPAASAVVTYAIGKVFVHHLENGGTLLTFEAKKMKEYMEKAVAEGKKRVPRWGTPAPTAAPSPAPSV
jgi:uncharacterized protein (DUF697 family)